MKPDTLELASEVDQASLGIHMSKPQREQAELKYPVSIMRRSQ